MADRQDKIRRFNSRKVFATRRGKWFAVIFGMIVVIYVLVMKFCIGTRPVKFSKDRVHKITISIDYFTSTEQIDGFAEITDSAYFADVLETVNNIRTRYSRLYDEIMEEPPTLSISTRDQSDNELESLDIYWDVLRIYGDKDYKISMSEYKRLEKICEKYGYVHYYTDVDDNSTFTWY